MEATIDFKVRESITYTRKGNFDGDLEDLIEMIAGDGEHYWIDDDYSVYDLTKSCVGHVDSNGDLILW